MIPETILSLYCVLVVILFGHWIADFVLQSHWMAVNKSENWYALSLHVLVYTSAMTMFASFFVQELVLFFYITFILHFVTDAITSRITKRLWANGDVHNFFVVIGFDQFLHVTTLVATVMFLL